MVGTGGESRPAYVLVRGLGPLGSHYEFITYRVKPEPGKEFPANGARCFQLEFPEARGLFNAGCGIPPARGGLLYGGTGGSSGQGAGYRFASGRVSEDIATVEIDVNDRPIPVELVPIPTDLVDRFQIRRPFKFFIAFFDPKLRSGTVSVIARDLNGSPVDRRTSKLFGGA